MKLLLSQRIKLWGNVILEATERVTFKADVGVRKNDEGKFVNFPPLLEEITDDPDNGNGVIINEISKTERLTEFTSAG